MKKNFLCVCVFLLSFCNTNDPNSTARLLALGESNFNSDGPLIIPLLGRVDNNVTNNCGTVINAKSDSKDNNSSTSNSPKTINSILTFQTRETLALKFKYDSKTTNGKIESSQGFVFTSGSLIKNSVTGTQGTVDWSQGSVFIRNNTVNVLKVNVSLLGKAKEGSETVTTQTCNTSNGTNCTSSDTNGRTCLTSDNKTCLAASTDGKDVIIQGSINCVISN